MKKTVLIPTDFSISSLNVVKALLNHEDSQTKMEFILLHGIRTGDSITDLLFFSKTNFMESLTDDYFEEACDIIRNKYHAQIHCIRKDLFTGLNQAAFNHYLQANNVSAIYVPGGYQFKKVNKRSFDTLPFIQRCPMKTMKINWNNETKLPEKGILAEVFFNGVSAG